MDRPVIVLGSGGHSKVVIDVLRHQDVRILGIVEADATKVGNTMLGIEIIGDDSAILGYSPEQIYLINAVGSAGVSEVRERLFMQFKQLGYNFAITIHPSAVIASDVQLGEGVQVMAGAIIQAGTVIGKNTIVNTKASIDHDCIIGEHVHISPGATLSGNVTVGESCHIGAGSTVIQGIQIGCHTLIGAGAVVVRNISDYKVAIGIPAKEVNVCKHG